MSPTYVVTDIESDGPVPGEHSMFSFASVAMTHENREVGTFEAVLLPLTDAARGAAAQALLDRGYGKSMAVSMDIVDVGQAHLEALQELADWRQRINREKTPAEAV